MEAEARVIEGNRRIALQRKLVRTLETDGLPSAGAKRLLAQYEESQASRVADRDRLAKELFGREN